MTGWSVGEREMETKAKHGTIQHRIQRQGGTMLEMICYGSSNSVLDIFHLGKVEESQPDNARSRDIRIVGGNFFAEISAA